MFAVDTDRYYPGHTDKKQDLVETLPPGIYEFAVEQSMMFSRPLFKKSSFKEGLIELRGNPFTAIKNRIRKFFSERTTEIYRDTKTLQFLGCLLYGPPGTGKTCFIEKTCEEFAQNKNAVVIRITDEEHIPKLPMIIKLARNSDENAMVIVILEEFDKYITPRYNGHIQKALIDFCDGYLTPSNVLLIATTNYIDKIPDELKKRPSRFSIVEEIDSIPELVAKQMIDKFLPEKYREGLNMEEITYFITEKKVRIDQIKHIVLNMLVNGMNVEQATALVIKNPVVGAPVGSAEEDDDDDDDV